MNIEQKELFSTLSNPQWKAQMLFDQIRAQGRTTLMNGEDQFSHKTISDAEIAILGCISAAIGHKNFVLEERLNKCLSLLREGY